MIADKMRSSAIRATRWCRRGARRGGCRRARALELYLGEARKAHVAADVGRRRVASPAQKEAAELARQPRCRLVELRRIC